MNFSTAIDRFIAQERGLGFITRDETEEEYRAVLRIHRELSEAVDLAHVEHYPDIARTLRHWGHPSKKRAARLVLHRFYEWTISERIRRINPVPDHSAPKVPDHEADEDPASLADQLRGACDTARQVLDACPPGTLPADRLGRAVMLMDRCCDELRALADRAGPR
jgi:site-specific recombinase XerC